MARDSGQIDLNADVVLHDRENEVLGFNSLGSKGGVGVGGETRASEPVGVCDQKVCCVGDDKGGGNSGSVEPLSEILVGGLGMNVGHDMMVNDSGKEGFGKGDELVGGGTGLEVGLGVDDGGCRGKEGEFLGGFVGNDDMKIVMGFSEGGPVVCGDSGSDEGLGFGLNGGVENEMERENDGRFSENSVLKDKVASANGAQGVGNVTVVREDGTTMEGVDNLITKEGLEDSHALQTVTCHVQCGSPDMGVADVKSKEFLHQKDSVFQNHHVLDTSYDVKQPAIQADAQVGVAQNQTIDINHSEAGHLENNLNEHHGFNLVVDLNCNRNRLDIDLCMGSMLSEQNFCVSDLVWAKVKGHPWWPGQVIDSSAASEKAKRHLKKDGYLIAYFGDQTFAWNDSSMIKPFQLHFSQMVKQSNMESFRHAVDCALDELSRRVEFGLSCPCLPEDILSKLKTQVITNSGICGESIRRDGGDKFVNATSFEPMKLVNFVKSLAQSPLTESDRLDFTIAHAQLSAFNCSKGYSQLPESPVLGGLLNDMEIPPMQEKEQPNNQTDGRGVTTHLGFPQKRKHSSSDSNQPSKRHKLVSDLMSEKSYCIPDAGHAFERSAGNQSVPRRRGRPRKIASNISDDNNHDSQTGNSAQLQQLIPMEIERKAGDQSVPRRRGRPRKIVSNISDGNILPSQTGKSSKLQHIPMELERKAGHQSVPRRRGRPRKIVSNISDGNILASQTGKSSQLQHIPMELERKAGHQSVPRRRGRLRKGVYNILGDNIHNSQTSNFSQLQHISVDDMRSQLCLAATDPVGQSCLSDRVYFLKEFRNFICRNSSAYLGQEMSFMHMHAGEAGVTSIEPVAPVTSAMELCNDSYWTDRVIQCIPEEQPSSKNQNGRGVFFPGTQSGYPLSKSQPAPEIIAGTNQGSELPSSPKPAEHLDESSAEDTTPTAFSLKFTSLDSVPPIAELNRIFGRFGPLIESRTEMIEKSKRVRVVFKRREDAETAFSSAGKYSIFGPALVSYRLKILPRPMKKGTGKQGTKGKEETSSSVHGAAA